MANKGPSEAVPEARQDHGESNEQRDVQHRQWPTRARQRQFQDGFLKTRVLAATAEELLSAAQTQGSAPVFGTLCQEEPWSQLLVMSGYTRHAAVEDTFGTIRKPKPHSFLTACQHIYSKNSHFSNTI